MNRPIGVVIAVLLMVSATDAATYYVSPSGNNSNPGTQASPFATIQKGHDVAVAGDTIFVRGGTYTVTTQTVLSRNGTSANRIKLFAFAGEFPVFDANGMTGTPARWIIRMTGSWWHIKGLELQNNHAGGGIVVTGSGSNNILEQNVMHDNSGSAFDSMGIFLFGNAGNNLVLNNDAYCHKDDNGEDAEGFFTATAGGGNVFRGNRAWRNTDQGFANFCTQAVGAPCPAVVWEYNWAWENGYTCTLTVEGGNGRGFKMGGGVTGQDRLSNNVSWSNRAPGFDENSASTGQLIYNNTAYNNGGPANFYFANGSTAVHVFRNNLNVTPNGVLTRANADLGTTNSWSGSPAFTVNASDFVSLNDTCMRGARQANGDLPVCSFLHLVSGSDLIDRGAFVGVAFNGAAPDLGAFEFVPPSSDTTAPTVSVTAPAASAVVSGPAVTISATASDNVGVVGVQFKVDGSNVGAEDTTAPYSVSWNTTVGFTDGSHAITAVARDASGNAATSSTVNVTVDNLPSDTTPPSVSISAPDPNTGVSGNPTIVTASASDNVAVAGVQFKVDGSNIGSEDTTSPYSVNWDSSTLAGGNHTLTAVARDSSSNTATSPGRTVKGYNGQEAAFWTFDAGTTAANVDQANLNDFTLSATGASLAPGRIGDGLTLDGGTALASTTRGLTATSALTIAAWVKIVNATGLQTLVSKGQNVPRRGFALSLNNGALRFVKIEVADVQSTVTVPTGAWHHVAVTWLASSGDVKFYLDGTLSQTINNAPALLQYFDGDPLQIGTFVNSASFFNGQVDDLRIYNSALSNTAVAAIAADDLDAPTVSITAPANQATVSGGSVSVTANASDDIGVVGVQFQLDQVNLGAEDVTAPYSVTWDTGPVSNGLHSLTAIARDASGKSTESDIITVDVQNSDTIAPTVNITSPANGAVVSGTISLTAGAADNEGVAGVQLKLDGANFGPEDTSSPYTVQLVTSILSNGSHTVAAVARDTSSNTTTSATVTFTVANSSTSKTQLSVALQNSLLQSIENGCGTSPILYMYDGIKPADVASADNGTILATMQLPADWLNTPANGIATKNGVWRDPSADATGTLKYLRIKSSGGVACLQGAITVTGGGGLVTFPSLSVDQGTPISIGDTFKLKQGNQ